MKYKPRNYAFGSQISRIGQALEKKGIKRDTIDLPHILDRTLTYRENKRLASNYVHKNIFDSDVKGRVSSIELYEKAEQQNNNRSQKSRQYDDKKRAKNTYFPQNLTKKQYVTWRKNPNRNDIEGVDTEGRFY